MRIEIGDYVFYFDGSSRSTRHGFAHDCWLLWYDVSKANDYNTARATCQYLNRTWENYTFQSVYMAAVRGALDAYLDAAREQYKIDHGYKRLPSAQREHFARTMEHDTTARTLRAVLDVLATCRGCDVKMAAA